MAATIDADKFYNRVSKFYSAWKSEEIDQLQDVDAVYFGLSSEDETIYGKTQTLQYWLFSYQLPDCLTVFCKDKIFLLASKKKIEFLNAVQSDEEKNGIPPVKCLVRDKGDKDKANFATLVKAIEESGNGKKLGVFVKDKPTGDFMPSWAAAVKKAAFQTCDVSGAFALIVAPKDKSEVELTEKACKSSCLVWSQCVRKEIVDIVDKDKKKYRHERLTEVAEKAFTDRSIVGGLNINNLETCFTPIFQSGGKYALKFSSTSDKNPVNFGAIVCAFGGRYSSYCSNICRTILVDPSKSTESAYNLLKDAEEAVIQALKPGQTLADAYEAGLAVIKEAQPDLVPKMTKNFGFATGIEFKESSLLIQESNKTEIKEGMIFVVNLGLTDLPTESKDDKKLAVWIGDTVLVEENGGKSMTDAAKKLFKNIRIIIEEDDEEEKEDDNKENIADTLGRGKRSVVLHDQLRKKESNEEKRKAHQKELAEKINAAAQERLAQLKDKPTQSKAKKSTVSYKNCSMMPNEPEVHSMRIFVDKKYETVVLPIFGVPVPFHISVIKNISQSVEGDFTYLRVNFTHPGSSIGKESKETQFPNPLATFVKEMTYRASNLKEPGEINAPSSNLNTAFRLIKEVQKRFKTREQEEQEKEGVVKQDKLVVSQNKGNPRLKDVYIRPNIVSKRVAGTVEAHVNGFRYTSLRGDKVDIMYNNIKHAFFQPCDHEMIILLHFHLKNPVLFGKKKHRDIQFFTEVGEITTDLGRYHHMQDRDDIYAEQSEKEMRHRLNAAFKSFTERVKKLTNDQVEFDTPFRALGFTGVPHRSAVLLQPTSGCLVHLTEWPPFVITLEEVELCHFERVSFQLKNFDMVFVFKEYSRKVEMVQQVPMTLLENVKQWLDECDIRYTEGLQSLNWQRIMKTIVDDPDQFFADGGWNFLGGDESGDEGGEDEESDEGDDAYRPSDASDDASEESDDDDEDEDSPEPSSDSASDASMDSEEESGKDWSDLEEEAKKADKERGYEEMEEDRHKKRKHGHAPSSSKGKAPPAKRRK